MRIYRINSHGISRGASLIMAFNEALHELFSFIWMNNQCYLKELQVM
jgi:hypothetical protein